MSLNDINKKSEDDSDKYYAGGSKGRLVYNHQFIIDYFIYSF